ncbi:DUF721 domain-containing protein [Actinopolyspora mortivallis]|uniref:DUF721 domain-containing protein n=1 Tax=Actinopolyspora mortivallis TaxID=33906 RepID=A0A2T0GTF2_ACTMO|nr:DciA family protein [Actinopolyspora mortivallis]PRW62370.1 DUF721 domain-containing protein [Actinopolyspora mortivallis]
MSDEIPAGFSGGTGYSASSGGPGPGNRGGGGGGTSGGSGTGGDDLARAALRAVRERSGATTRRSPGGETARSRRRRGWSGAASDDRDPQSLGELASRMAADRGWSERLAGGQVFGRWTELVGEEIAAHSEPVELREGVLVVQAESTAWATQLRLLQRQIVRRVSDGLGRDLVRRIRVQGPAAPSWRRGPRHVSGRGPRDTYG